MNDLVHKTVLKKLGIRRGSRLNIGARMKVDEKISLTLGLFDGIVLEYVWEKVDSIPKADLNRVLQEFNQGLIS